MKDNYKLGKHRMIKSRTDLKQLFEDGNDVFAFPIKCVYKSRPEYNLEQCQIAIVAPKRIHRKAVDRNLLKRRVREAFRLNQGVLNDTHQSFQFVFIYIGKEILPYHKIEKSMIKLLNKVNKV